MTGPEKLSVLLPVYNTRSDWLTVAVESVLNQTYREFELLLLNDGSTNPDTWGGARFSDLLTEGLVG